MPQVETGQCRLAEGKSCDYFREALLPAADCPQRIRDGYTMLDQTAKMKDRRRCPECQAELRPRQRFCEKCADMHRRASYLKKRQKQCMSAPQLSSF